jgi:HPt (histidine-containing phosphotransfer) domain-containing protein
MNSNSILDLDDVLARLGGDESLFVEVAEIFIDDFAVHLGSIKDEKSSSKEVSRAFHSVAGAAGNIGAKDLSKLSKEMELLAAEKSVDNEQLDAFTDLANKTIEVVREAIVELGKA